MRLASVFLLPAMIWGQGSVLTVAPVEKVHGKRNDVLAVKLLAQLRDGYHVNSNKPNEEYLIPIKLTWQAEPLQVEEVAYPKAHAVKSGFSENPLSVYSGAFEIVTRMKVPGNAPAGPVLATGKLRYQACNDRMCLPPKTVDVPLTIYIQ